MWATPRAGLPEPAGRRTTATPTGVSQALPPRQRPKSALAPELTSRPSLVEEMALSSGLPFETPEEYFLGQAADANFSLSGWDPRSYAHPTPPSAPALLPSISPTPELVLFVGSPASGKSTYFDRHFHPAGYAWVNQDTLKTRPKCLSTVEAALLEGKSVVVDNTNPSKEVRREYLDLVKRLGLGTKVRVGWFEADERTCRQNSVYRALAGGAGGREILPGIAFVMFLKSFKPPVVEEGQSGRARLESRRGRVGAVGVGASGGVGRAGADRRVLGLGMQGSTRWSGCRSTLRGVGRRRQGGRASWTAIPRGNGRGAERRRCNREVRAPPSGRHARSRLSPCRATLGRRGPPTEATRSTAESAHRQPAEMITITTHNAVMRGGSNRDA